MYTSTSENAYKIGQVVSLRLPRTYWVITKVFNGSIFDEEPVYTKGGILVKPMKPVKNIFGKPLPELDYYFENKLFSWMVQVIDPAEEISRLRELNGKKLLKENINLEQAIKFLTQF